MFLEFLHSIIVLPFHVCHKYLCYTLAKVTSSARYGYSLTERLISEAFGN